jgi:hypothetical protein
MSASSRIKQVEDLMWLYTESVRRSGMQDLAIWQSLRPIYAQPDDYELVLTSTQEEAFDRMVADNWIVNMGDHFYGLDYETIDELVLEYLKESKLVKDLNEEEQDVD